VRSQDGERALYKRALPGMTEFRITIPRHLLDQAAELARQCSTDLARERVLISRAVGLALADWLEQSGVPTSDGRASELKYLDLLDICDFNVGGWTIEVRAQTHTEEPALYVPTMPLIVGVLSDYYVCAQVDTSLAYFDVLGFATRAELSEAELSNNGLFLLQPIDDLHPLSELKNRLSAPRPVDPDRDRLYTEWRDRAERVMRGLGGLLEGETVFGPNEMAYIARRLRDDILRTYGDRLPPTGLEPLYHRLFRRFGIERPVPAAPHSPVAFETPTDSGKRAEPTEAPAGYLLDSIPVRERASLYRDLISDARSFDEHHRTQRILDASAGGTRHSTGRRRSQVAEIDRHKSETDT
jgi:hypothetical protein